MKLQTANHKQYWNNETDLYDLNTFWADHKKALPIHYQVYLGDCASKRAASASVETVYCSTLELPSLPMVLIDLVTSCWQPIVFCHYNWQFPFLRPTRDEIVGHYRKVHGSEPPPEEQEEKEDQADADEAHAETHTEADAGD